MTAVFAAILAVLTPYQHLDALGSPRFRVREAATAALKRCGENALPALEWGAAKHRDPEVRHRCEALLLPHADRLAERDARALLAGWPHVPWLWDAGDGYGGEGVDYWLDRAGWGKPWFTMDADRAKAGLPYTWPQWREATRKWVTGQLRAGRSAAAILGDLEAMYTAERDWTANHAGEYMPRLIVPPPRPKEE